MPYDEGSLQQIDAVVRDWRRYGRDIIAMLARGPSRGSGRILVRSAIVRETLTARIGRQKGKGKVDIVCDVGDGSGLDAIRETGVVCWNPLLTEVKPSQTAGVDRQVLTIAIDGLVQLMGGDCPI